VRIAVVVGSTRPGRIGDRIRRFVVRKAALIGGADFVVVDLADYPMPFFDESAAPLSNPMILSYSTTTHGGILAGQQLRLALSKAGMHPLPKSLPLAHANRLLNEAGDLIEKSNWAARVDEFVLTSLGDLVTHTSAFRTIRHEVAPAS
jgi:NAD(P)H-dependent FMN reductase